MFRTPEDFCDISSGWLTGFGGLATYIVPKWDVLLATTFTSRPFAGSNFPGITSQSLVANWLVFNNSIVPELGRPMSGNSQVTFVNVVEPGTLYGERINQLDLRVSKILRFGGTRTNVGVDVYNVFNTSAAYQYLQTLQHAHSGDLVAAEFARLGAVCEAERAVRFLAVLGSRQ